MNVRDHLLEKDPLTKETAEFLVKYSEEDDRVDYKQSIDPASEKDWLEITKDISAFANTYGGYIVFGINDSEKKIVGLTKNITDIIKDANNVHQKINRHLEPNIIGLRAKEFKIGDHSIVIIYIPQSVGITHMISKEGVFDHPVVNRKHCYRKELYM